MDASLASRRTSTQPASTIQLLRLGPGYKLAGVVFPLTTPSETPSASCNAHNHSANKTHAPFPAAHSTAPTCSCIVSRAPTFPPPPAAPPPRRDSALSRQPPTRSPPPVAPLPAVAWCSHESTRSARLPVTQQQNTPHPYL